VEELSSSFILMFYLLKKTDSLGFEGNLKIRHLCNSECVAANLILTCPLITVFLYTVSILGQIFVLLELLWYLAFTSKRIQ